MMQQIQLRQGSSQAVSRGHPWVYRNQIDAKNDLKTLQPGDIVTVQDDRGRYLGTGFYNPHSMITVRLLTHRKETVDDALIVQRVQEAVAYRKQFARADTDSYRMIFAEADRLPGVIADQFADTVVLQILALGMERWTDCIARTLLDELQPKRLLIQNDEPIRLKEGLLLERKLFHGTESDSVVIRENGLKMQVDLQSGQKTGYFLDQKANHARIRSFVKNKRVLDCFCYSGGFALNAAVAGAASVIGVDSSEHAVHQAKTNAALNQLTDQIDWVTANGFDYLRQASAQQDQFDVIVLDPPAFAKNHAARRAARRGYKEINLSAFRLLPPGGILATHSCSFHMPESLFLETVLEAARDVRRVVRILDVHRQDFDHPVLAGYPESHYLKSLWIQVLA